MDSRTRGVLGVGAIGLLGAFACGGCATISEQREERLLARDVVRLPPRPEAGPPGFAAEGWVEDERIAVRLFEERGAFSETVGQELVEIKTVREPDSWWWLVGELAATSVATAIAVNAHFAIERCGGDHICKIPHGFIQFVTIPTAIGFGVTAVVEAARTYDPVRKEVRMTPAITLTRTTARGGIGPGKKLTILWNDVRIDGVTNAEGVATFAVDAKLLPSEDFSIEAQCEGQTLPGVSIRRRGGR